MTCKYCGADANWPENYVVGCKMIENETGIVHTRERCNQIQNPIKKKEWYNTTCTQCNMTVRQNPKFFRKPDPKTFVCYECSQKKFINLHEYGLEL